MAKRLLVLSCRVPSADRWLACSLVACKADTMWERQREREKKRDPPIICLWLTLARQPGSAPRRTTYARNSTPPRDRPTAACNAGEMIMSQSESQSVACNSRFLVTRVLLFALLSLARSHQHFFSRSEEVHTVRLRFLSPCLGVLLGDGHKITRLRPRQTPRRWHFIRFVPPHNLNAFRAKIKLTPIWQRGLRGMHFILGNWFLWLSIQSEINLQTPCENFESLQTGEATWAFLK